MKSHIFEIPWDVYLYLLNTKFRIEGTSGERKGGYNIGKKCTGVKQF
jgi:hypothetical protein